MDRTTIDRRRGVEDRAIELRAERGKLRCDLRENTVAITSLLEDAVSLGIAVEQFARLVGVRRQSLYRWRADARPNSEASE